MDDFARQPSDERQIYFEQAAIKFGLTSQLIEKDFWVCWILRRLFSLDDFHDQLTFKGGTSLSKVYHVIERFSEDVDVAIDRNLLGFDGERGPEKGTSGKEQQRRVVKLKEACQETVLERLMPQLRDAIQEEIGEERGWKLVLDDADPDMQTLLFQYPPAITEALSPYFAASVKIELGARSDHFPVEMAAVTPYLCENNKHLFNDAAVNVRVLTAARTFWEKATILHMLHHQPIHRKTAPRMSRHYYDVFQMSNSPIWEQSLNAIELLDRVAVFKSVFFKSAWAMYDEAKPGTLSLVPQNLSIGDLTKDYAAMRPMFFNKPPDFEEILARLPELENRINEFGQG